MTMFDCEVLQRHIIDGATIVEGIMRRFRRPPLATCTLPVGVYYLLTYLFTVPSPNFSAALGVHPRPWVPWVSRPVRCQDAW